MVIRSKDNHLRNLRDLEIVDFQLELQVPLEPRNDKLSDLSARRVLVRVANWVPLATIFRILDKEAVSDVEVADCEVVRLVEDLLIVL